MPHLQNCQHQDEGWCLACVKAQHEELEQVQARNSLLEVSNLLWSATFQKYSSQMANGVRRVPIEKVVEDYRKCSAASPKVQR